MQMGNATVTVGGGPAILTLPDIDFISTANGANNNTISKLETDDIDGDVGYSISGEVTLPVGGSGAVADTVAVRGFYANIDSGDRLSCTGTASVTCAVDSIIAGGAGSIFTAVGATLTADTGRDVDQWSAAIEARRDVGNGAPRYVALGADIRGIDQDTTISVSFNAAPQVTYGEDLDTRYYGAYAAIGGDYKPLLFKGLWSRLGLTSSFRLQGGVYAAETDYDGRYVNFGVFPGSSTLSLSDDDVAFIGGLTLETRKRIGARAALTLTSEYEYYSWVPEMLYNDLNVTGTAINTGTSIGDDDAFSMRTMLRLTIGLGPRDLYEPSTLK